MRIGVIGTGKIATAVIRGIAGDGHDIVVSDRSRGNAMWLDAHFDNVSVADNAGVIAASDVILLGLLPDAAPGILEGLAFREGQKVISLMAGIPLERLAPLVAPAQAVANALPFPAIADGPSPLLAVGDIALVEAVAGTRNPVFTLRDAEEMNAALCAQAVLSPVVQMVHDAAEWLAPRLRDGAQGEAFLRMLIASNLSTQPCAPLLEALNTPGGYNRRLRQHMETAGMRSALEDGLKQLENG